MAEPGPGTGPRATAAVLLRRSRLWLLPTVLTGLLALPLSLLYMGGIVSPNQDLLRRDRPAPGRPRLLPLPAPLRAHAAAQ